MRTPKLTLRVDELALPLLPLLPLTASLCLLAAALLCMPLLPLLCCTAEEALRRKGFLLNSRVSNGLSNGLSNGCLDSSPREGEGDREKSGKGRITTANW
jgi:hypothetical protein